MKKSILSVFGGLLVLTLLLGSFGSVKAATSDAPVVIPVSGDMVFTTSVVPIVALPGTTNFGTLPVPVGFPAGEAQYGGDGVRVTGMDSGKATACFYLATIKVNQGWSGKVAVWNGTKWVKLATTITPFDESPTSLACATITGNGTYAFIMGFADNIPTSAYKKCGELSMAAPYSYDFYTDHGWMDQGGTLTDYYLPVGTPVSYEIILQNPVGFFHSGTFGSGIVTGPFVPDDDTIIIPAGMYASIITFDPRIEFTYDYFANLHQFTFRVYLPNCYTDFVYPDDLYGSDPS